MTAAALVADLRRRGVQLEAVGDRLRYAPKDALSPADVAALRAVKQDVLRLLTADTPPEPTTCGLCGSHLVLVPDWPSVGDSRWLCIPCAQWPAPALADILANLTAAELERLDVEVAGADTLAGTLVSEFEAMGIVIGGGR